MNTVYWPKEAEEEGNTTGLMKESLSVLIFKIEDGFFEEDSVPGAFVHWWACKKSFGGVVRGCPIKF